MAEPPSITIRGGILEGVVYLRADDVITSLRLTAQGYRQIASEEDDDISDVFIEVARLFEGEADEFDLISMQIVTDDVDDVAEPDEESDG